MRFITQMNANRATGEKDMDAAEFLSDHQKRGNRVGYKVNEVLKDNPVVRLYCDFDHKTDDVEPTQEQKDSDYEILRDIMNKIVPDMEVAYAHRNGWKVVQNRLGAVTYEGWAISYRAYVKGVKMCVSDIPKYITMKLGGNIPDGLDLSVYKVSGHGQLLGTIGAHKFDHDTRILTPLTHEDDPLAFVCQHLYGDEQLITLPDTTIPPPAYSVKDKSKKVTKKTSSKTVASEETYPIRSLISDEEAYKQMIEQPVVNLTWISMIPMLESMGFAQLQLVSVGEFGFNFDADRSVNCPICQKRQHESNHWYIMRLTLDIFVARNYSMLCHLQVVNWENNPYINKLLTLQKCDSPYAEMFAKVFDNRLYWTTNDRYVFYNNHRWEEMPKARVIGSLKNMFHSIITKLMTCLSDKQNDNNVDTTTPEREHHQERTRIRRKLDAAHDALRFSQSMRNLANIEKLLQAEIFDGDFEDKLDKDPYLLGVDNGVIDLKTCVYRHGMPSDYVSKSVGYKFIHPESSDYDSTIMVDVEEYIARIYPIEEEREWIQRYAGYCLLGNHKEKIFCICIDEREGFNGKTQAGQMWISALGPDYTKDAGNNAIIYQSEFQESVNSHAGGMMAYDGIRLVVIEEITKHRRLNNALLKKLHGGSMTYAGRDCNAKKERTFNWTAKMIINTNNGQMADFDWHDGAFCERMKVIRHRSKFCLEEAVYECNKHEPYTFMAIDRSEEIKTIWRPYILLWMLKGLERYHQLRFTKTPASFNEFKQSLIGQQDPVTPWVTDMIEKTDERSRFVTRSQLYDLFKQSNPEEKVRKTAIGVKLFGDRVSKALDLETTELFTWKDSDGTKYCRRNCYVGYGLKGSL